MSINSVSEPPVNITEKGVVRVTFADVAMKVARDGPMYAVIILCGVLAIRGTSTASESMMGSAMALLARSWPGAIQVDGGNGNLMRGIRNIGILALAITSIHLISACTGR